MASLPRPILKRSSSTSSASSSSCSSLKSTVQFASNISTTYFTHGSCYNRSPIHVSDVSDCYLPRGRTMDRELAVNGSLPWNPDIDGYDSVMIREDEDSAEYYDSLTPLPPPTQTASVFAPSPSAYLNYHAVRSEFPSNSSSSRSGSAFMPGFIAAPPRRKLSNSSDSSGKSPTWSCLDGF